MNEKLWLGCTHPDPMLRFLRGSGKASNRKVRLFTCALCRQVWHFLVQEASRNSVDVTERFADGQGEDYDRGMAYNAADRAAQGVAHHLGEVIPHLPSAPRLRDSHADAAYAAADAAQPNVWDAVDLVADQTMKALREGYDESCLKRSMLLRDIFGLLPFRDVHIDSAWLSWNNNLIPRLAEAAYNERQLPGGTLDVARLAVLADALEEAGCHDAGLLGHLRSEGPHVRGCWALDLLLQKG
jgi:hypothetical protein